MIHHEKLFQSRIDDKHITIACQNYNGIVARAITSKAQYAPHNITKNLNFVTQESMLKALRCIEKQNHIESEKQMINNTFIHYIDIDTTPNTDKFSEYETTVLTDIVPKCKKSHCNQTDWTLVKNKWYIKYQLEIQNEQLNHITCRDKKTLKTQWESIHKKYKSKSSATINTKNNNDATDTMTSPAIPVAASLTIGTDKGARRAAVANDRFVHLYYEAMVI